jgi:hypothetical protein
MALVTKAEHTTSWFEPGQVAGNPSPRRIVHPARPGDAHLVDSRGRSLCGRDGKAWKAVTSKEWRQLGEYRCPACLTRLAEYFSR